MPADPEAVVADVPEVSVTAKPGLWLTLIACTLVALAFNYFPCQLDDAFITYRYAAHVAEHGSLAFNLGQVPVEGFSSPLWLALLSFCALCFGKAALPNAASVMGMGFAMGACLLGFRYGSGLLEASDVPSKRATCAGLVSAVLLVVCPAIPYYAATGLEPMLFLSVALASLAALSGASPAWTGWAAALALPWTRPEAAALPVAWIALYALERSPERLRRLLLCSGLFCGSLAVLLSVRLWIFGDLLPNTYYAKLPDRTRGVGYVLELLSTSWVLALGLLGLLGAICGGKTHRALLLCAVLFFLVALAEGGDWMPLGRFAIPAFAALAVAASGILAARAKVVHLAAAAGASLFLFGSYSHTTAQLSLMHSARRTLGHEYAWLSSWLAKTGAGSIALMDIGAIGFDNDLTIVDLAGLTDRTLARMAGHHLRKRIDPSYIVEKRPDLIVVRIEKPPFGRPGAIDPNAAMTQIEGDLLASQAMAEQYLIAWMLLPGGPRDPYYGKVVFARHDFAIPAKLLPQPPIFSLEPLAD